MTDPALLSRLAAILPGEWSTVPHGYALTTPAGALAITTPYSQYLVRLNNGDALKTYSPGDLPTLIRRVLGEAVFAALLAGPDHADKALRDRRRADLNKRRQDAEAVLHQAQDALAAIDAEIATFDQENP